MVSMAGTKMVLNKNTEELFIKSRRDIFGLKRRMKSHPKITLHAYTQLRSGFLYRNRESRNEDAIDVLVAYLRAWYVPQSRYNKENSEFYIKKPAPNKQKFLRGLVKVNGRGNYTPLELEPIYVEKNNTFDCRHMRLGSNEIAPRFFSLENTITDSTYTSTHTDCIPLIQGNDKLWHIAKAQPKFDMLTKVIEFYTLEAMSCLFDTDRLPTHSYQRFCSDFVEYRENYENTLFYNMRDYLTVISAGETRHGVGDSRISEMRSGEYHTNFPLSNNMSGGRTAIPIKVIEYEPISLLACCELIFNKFGWVSGYGGSKWGNIAKVAKLMWESDWPKRVLIDHAIDLSHNGTYCFNKPSYQVTGNIDRHNYQCFLDLKRDESPLEVLVRFTETQKSTSMGFGQLFLRSLPFLNIEKRDKKNLLKLYSKNTKLQVETPMHYVPFKFGTEQIWIVHWWDSYPESCFIVNPPIEELAWYEAEEEKTKKQLAINKVKNDAYLEKKDLKKKIKEMDKDDLLVFVKNAENEIMAKEAMENAAKAVEVEANKNKDEVVTYSEVPPKAPPLDTSTFSFDKVTNTSAINDPPINVSDIYKNISKGLKLYQRGQKNTLVGIPSIPKITPDVIWTLPTNKPRFSPKLYHKDGSRFKPCDFDCSVCKRIMENIHDDVVLSRKYGITTKKEGKQ